MDTYVCLLSTDNYLEGVLVLNYNLQQLHSTHDLLCLITDNISDKTKDILNFFNIKYKIVKNLKYDSDQSYTRWNPTFSKFYVFSLTEYNKVVYLDSDFLILENIDHLFNLDSFTMNSDMPYHQDKYNSSIMIIKPDLNDFNKLVAGMNSYSEKNITNIGDQNIINDFLSNISSLDSSYNVMRYLFKDEEKDYYRTQVVTTNVTNPKVIHYIGSIKPFMVNSFTDEYSYIYEDYLNKVRTKIKEFEKDKI